MRLRPTTVEFAVLLAIAVVLGNLAFDEYRSYRGQRDGLADAEADLAAGVLHLKFGGKAQPWKRDVDHLFRERYGIEDQHIYGCCPTEYQSSYARVYNDRVVQRIHEKWPAFSINQVFDDGHREWNKSRATSISTGETTPAGSSGR